MQISLPGSRSNQKVSERKLKYGEKLKSMLTEYNKCLVVTVDNVSSSQIDTFRKTLRGRARFLFGKNTMMRKIIRNFIKETGNRQLNSLADLVRGNSGFCFTNCEPGPLRREIIDAKVQCAAKPGTLAPDDVHIPAGPTGMEPTQTQFFQSMDIPTRINRGQIDIVNSVHLIKKGEKVGLSEATLLIKLGIKPFYYGMQVESVYDDGAAYDAAILDITDDDMSNAFFNGMNRVAALSFAIKHPTIPIVPHSCINGYKQVLSIGLALKSYTWENLDLVRDRLENPDKYGGGGGGSGGGGGAPAAAAAVVKEATPSESSSESGDGPTLFGDDDSSSDDDSSD